MAQIYILGTGTPTPTALRFGTSYVLRLGKDYLMFDCGPATTYKLVKVGLFPTQVNYLFFTHHHFDHNADYPCFLLCRWDQSTGKENPLRVYGPRPTERITEGIIGEGGVFSLDWKARVNAPVSQRVHVNRGGSLPRPKPFLKVRDLEEGKVTAGSDWEVIAAKASHVQPYLESLAYRVNSDEVSIVITGDTHPCESIRNLAANADVLLCMCWDHQEIMERNGEAEGQTGTLGAAALAKEAEVKKLILVHTGPHLSTHVSMEKAIGDISRIYGGEVIFAEELMTLSV